MKRDLILFFSKIIIMYQRQQVEKQCVAGTRKSPMSTTSRRCSDGLRRQKCYLPRPNVPDNDRCGDPRMQQQQQQQQQMASPMYQSDMGGVPASRVGAPMYEDVPQFQTEAMEQIPMMTHVGDDYVSGDESDGVEYYDDEDGGGGGGGDVVNQQQHSFYAGGNAATPQQHVIGNRASFSNNMQLSTGGLSDNSVKLRRYYVSVSGSLVEWSQGINSSCDLGKNPWIWQLGSMSSNPSTYRGQSRGGNLETFYPFAAKVVSDSNDSICPIGWTISGFKGNLYSASNGKRLLHVTPPKSNNVYSKSNMVHVSKCDLSAEEIEKYGQYGDLTKLIEGIKPVHGYDFSFISPYNDDGSENIIMSIIDRNHVRLGVPPLERWKCGQKGYAVANQLLSYVIKQIHDQMINKINFVNANKMMAKVVSPECAPFDSVKFVSSRTKSKSQTSFHLQRKNRAYIVIEVAYTLMNDSQDSAKKKLHDSMSQFHTIRKTFGEDSPHHPYALVSELMSDRKALYEDDDTPRSSSSSSSSMTPYATKSSEQASGVF